MNARSGIIIAGSVNAFCVAVLGAQSLGIDAVRVLPPLASLMLIGIGGASMFALTQLRSWRR